MKRVSGSEFSSVPRAMNLCLVDVVPNYASNFIPNATSNFISYPSDFVPNFASDFLVNFVTNPVFNPTTDVALNSVYESCVSKYSPLICPDSYPTEGGACRRFVIDRRREVQEERGCRRELCGSCFIESGSWKEGILFVNLELQSKWVNEFFDMVARPDENSEAVEVIAVRQRDWSREGPVDEPQTILIPSGNIFPPHIEE